MLKKAKVTLVLNEQKPNRIALRSKTNTTFKHAPSQVKENTGIFCQRTNEKT